MLRTDQLCTDQRAQPALIYPCILRFERCSPSLRLGGAHPYDTLLYVVSLPYIATTRGTNSSVPALHQGSCCILAKSSTGPHVNCEPQCYLRRRLVHTFDSKDLVDVYITDGQGGGDPDLPPDPAAEPESDESAGEEGVSEPKPALHSWAPLLDVLPTAPPIPLIRDAPSGLPSPPVPPTPPRGRSCTRSPRSPPGGQPQPLSPPQGRPPSPPPLIMSSPASPPDKETLKHLLPLRYDGKTVIECNRFISQLLIYWTINTALTTIELKIQVALSLLDGDARTWATPIFAQLAAVQIKIQGATTPFADEAAFLTAFKARFGNLDDAAAAQVELTKLCADKSLREKRTAAEFSALFKGLADRSGYGDLELRDKYLSGIPSRVYRKIKLETFTTWVAADKHATEVEQQLDISWACWPELNSFFSAQGRGHGGSRGGAPHSQGASASINAAVGKGDFPGECFGCRKKGYRRFECPNCKDKPYTKRADARAMVASGSTQAATSAPVASPSASTSAASANTELADLMAQVKSMHEELEHYRALKEESF
ncbi:hypothetical protein IEO21_06107 [Rhodonia placenta]|uniref:Retrotransposon gag domain-containing protein n=1 Tax=Rhodonia placenta TaxID=104341 RepID=A0A8H7U1L7_9APHY|nr:hypothetical protein IEO21_06107 [Postia placenta]